MDHERYLTNSEHELVLVTHDRLLAVINTASGFDQPRRWWGWKPAPTPNPEGLDLDSVLEVTLSEVNKIADEHGNDHVDMGKIDMADRCSTGCGWNTKFAYEGTYLALSHLFDEYGNLHDRAETS